MTNKALRILIADPQHFQRMKIERLFNHLDYYRVGAAQSLSEMLSLVGYGGEPFDVLVVNADLASGSMDLPAFLLDGSPVRHALIYNEPSMLFEGPSGVARKNLQICNDGMPSASMIERLMARVDVPGFNARDAAPEVQYSALPHNFSARNCQV
ncbi:chemotaxis protein CheY [Pseudomonas sp.]|jgi:hypothetical protein|uniref:chemotaxis protein CheY n=1 Tax=Pseudomonas sp. TaxID=306 RepID=UPI002E2EAA24|nr:chemotaxis protein CheY [Pseudomonas sp.]HEX4546793.1 chemotaxis protein CheY [Pseudomonas sp.]